MPETNPYINVITILVTTGILLFLGVLIIYFLFQYQRRRYKHIRDMQELRDTFNHTLMQSKLEIQEQTLQHVIRELHDKFGLLISNIKINLTTISPDKPQKLQEHIAEATSSVNELMTEFRALNVTLNSDHIMNTDFFNALKNELNRLERSRLYKTIITQTGEEYRLRPENEIILFRMCQEILNNMVKHAAAKTITVTVNYTPDLFTLQFTDDGKGFDLAQVQQAVANGSGTGLKNIQNRSKLIGATVTTSSSPGKGTTTAVSISTK